nr:hypothetical protein [Tanacetum cinerariifolium]
MAETCGLAWHHGIVFAAAVYLFGVLNPWRVSVALHLFTLLWHLKVTPGLARQHNIVFAAIAYRGSHILNVVAAMAGVSYCAWFFKGV